MVSPAVITKNNIELRSTQCSQNSSIRSKLKKGGIISANKTGLDNTSNIINNVYSSSKFKKKGDNNEIVSVKKFYFRLLKSNMNEICNFLMHKN